MTDNFGTPVSQEADFNINENAFYDDIHGVAKKFGIDWANAENLKNFIVKHLDNSEELNSEIEQTIKNNARSDNNKQLKPWWKFW